MLLGRRLKEQQYRRSSINKDLYSLDSAYGSLHLLKALLQKMQQQNIRPMADIVINHRVGTTRGKGGSYNRYDGINLPWDERAVTSCTGGLVPSSGGVGGDEDEDEDS
ncbi:hypothetical protein Taro_030855 [Colocasia esculenta]|uniref:Alpha-amylase n=1 Tax=Colocasia esculenta TaxID=4460 RepID=A0A843VMF5_COLES|nr:hypothetical protein [Colocasia esculenta]